MLEVVFIVLNYIAKLWPRAVVGDFLWGLKLLQFKTYRLLPTMTSRISIGSFPHSVHPLSKTHSGDFVSSVFIFLRIGVGLWWMVMIFNEYTKILDHIRMYVEKRPKPQL